MLKSIKEKTPELFPFLWQCTPRRFDDIGVTASLASVNGVFNLVCDISPHNKIYLFDIPFSKEAINAWNVLCPGNVVPLNPSNQNY